MRLVLCLLLSAICAVPVAGQVVDSFYAHDDYTEVRKKTNVYADEVASLSEGEVVAVIDTATYYVKVKIDTLNGWVHRSDGILLSEKRADQKAEERQRERARKTKQELLEKGYTLILAGQTFNRDSAGGIDIGLGLLNISKSKTIKYATATWQLFNPVGDPVEKGLESSISQTRFVGPLEPGEGGRSVFENVWHSDVGTCAELKRLKVEHIDGSSFTYVNDLKDISQLAETVRLEDDCSYEAQKRREQ